MADQDGALVRAVCAAGIEDRAHVCADTDRLVRRRVVSREPWRNHAVPAPREIGSEVSPGIGRIREAVHENRKRERGVVDVSKDERSGCRHLISVLHPTLSM